MTGFKHIPFERVAWTTTSFLSITLFLTLTAVPAYLIFFGMGWFMAGLLAFYLVATGLSITLGYHRLFAHLSFGAKWPVRMFVLLFGAAAWENSVLDWVSDHRRHHKHVDHDDDPYNINNGFFFAHVGWLLFKLSPEPPMDNVNDLRKDKWVLWQHRNVHWIALVVGFIVPAVLCGLVYGSWMAALGGFLIVGVLRTVIVQHATFCINSACHYFGKQPYSSKHSARDSWWIAFITYGEGYHNYHHEFQHDYRNGVKPWQFDPTKWTIWLLSKFGLTYNLRRVSDAKILLAELTEARRRMESGLATFKNTDLTEAARARLHASLEYLHVKQEELASCYYQVQKGVTERVEFSKAKVAQWRREINHALRHLDELLEVHTPAAATA
jgi:stearoyl-CoA desaturase (delta-9 desaturase)